MRIRTIVVAGAACLLSACVAPIAPAEGPLPNGAVLRAPAFSMPDADPSDPGLLAARGAVARDLVGKGLQERADAPYRVDVGLAVAPLPLEVFTGRARAAAAPQPAGIALCRRRQYTVSVAMIDRSDGRVLFRGSATARRCARSAKATIPRLARAALGR